MHTFRPPPRILEHRDGRRWEARVDGASLKLVVRDSDGDVFERSPMFDDSVAANRELERLFSEQLQDDFVDRSRPSWEAFLDELVEHWRTDDPAFDATSLRRMASREAAERLMQLGDRWIVRRDGTSRLDMQAGESVEAHTLWFQRHREDGVPALLLGLRHHDGTAQMQVDAILAALKPTDALDALLSIVEHPAANLAAHLGGRAVQHFPTYALIVLDAVHARRDRLVRALDDADFRIAGAAAHVLAEGAADDTAFEALLAHHERGKREDGFAWALMRAAEVRPDPRLRPFLQWMQKSRNFRSAGYPERIREALARLR